MPQRTPNTDNINVNLGKAYATKLSKASTHNEKLRLLDIQYDRGQTIKYTDGKGKLQMAMMLSEGEFVDLRTKKILHLNEAAPYLLKGAVASFRDVSNELKDVSSSMKNYHTHMLTLDVETAITGELPTKAADVFNFSMVGMWGEGENKTLRGTDLFVVDIFDEILKTDPSRYGNKAAGRAALSSMSGRVQDSFYKEFSKFAKEHNIGLGSIKNLGELVEKREVLEQLTTQMKQMGSDAVIYEDPTLNQRVISRYGKRFGTKKAEIKRGLIYANDVKQVTENAIGVRGTPSQYWQNADIGIFNAKSDGNVDEKTLEIMRFGRASDGDLNTIDLKGHQLFTNATLFPGMTDNLHVTLGPTLKNIAHKLRMSDKEKKVLFKSLDRGMASSFNPGTAAEDFHTAMVYSLGAGDKNFQFTTHHTAMIDNFNQMETSIMTKDFTDRALKEAHMPGYQFMSVKSRRMAAYAKSLSVAAMVKASPMKYSKRHATGIFNRRINMVKLAKGFEGSLESATSIKMERSMLQSNIGQFGGSTVANLLGGSLLLAGIRVAAMKARERFAPTRENNMEGIRHESIPTIVRRMSLTDFGSGLIKPNPVSGSIGILAQLFKGAINRPKAIARTVKKTQTIINQTIKDTKGAGSYIDLISDPVKMIKLNKQIFGPDKDIASMFDSLRRRNILDISEETVEKGLSVVRKTLDGMQLRKGLDKLFSKKKVRQTLTESIANTFVTRGIDKAGNTYIKNVKAPAVAIGAGALGALGIMLSRGKYDPEEMMRPIPTKGDLQYYRSRPERKRHSIRQQITDIKNSSQEGLEWKSKNIQRLRSTYTDFGSGVGPLGKKIIGGKIISPTLDAAENMVNKLMSKHGGGKVPFRVRLQSVVEYIDKAKHKFINKLVPKSNITSAYNRAISTASTNDVDMRKTFKMGTKTKTAGKQFKVNKGPNINEKHFVKKQTVPTRGDVHSRITGEDISIRGTNRPKIQQSIRDNANNANIKMINVRPNRITKNVPVKPGRYVETHNDALTGKDIHVRKGAMSSDITEQARKPATYAHMKAPSVQDDMIDAGKLRSSQGAPQPRKIMDDVIPDSAGVPDVVPHASAKIGPEDMVGRKVERMVAKDKLRLNEDALPSRTGMTYNVDTPSNINLKKLEDLHSKRGQGAPGMISEVKKAPIQTTYTSMSHDRRYPSPNIPKTTKPPYKHDVIVDGIRRKPNTIHDEFSNPSLTIGGGYNNVSSQNTKVVTKSMKTPIAKGQIEPLLDKAPLAKVGRKEMLFNADVQSYQMLQMKGMGHDKVPHNSSFLPYKLGVGNIGIERATLPIV